MKTMTKIRYEGWNMTYMTCQVGIDHPRDLWSKLGNLNGIQLKFGEGGRLGKGGHMENHEHTPKFELDWVFGWIGNHRSLRMFIKHINQPI